MVCTDTANPASAGAARGALKYDQLGEVIEIDISTTARFVQASRLGARFGLWPSTARAVASLAFGECRA